MASFTIRTTRPDGQKEYIRTANGGWSTCILGSPTYSKANTLANCVGYACGRFNEVYNILTGHQGNKYASLNCNAENFIERAISLGLKIVTEPVVGGIMVWRKGATLSGSDGAGHVAFVEKKNSATQVYTSESGYGSSSIFWNSTRNKGNGNWGAGSGYVYRGCIVNPAVGESGSSSGGSDTPTGGGDKFKIGDKVIINGSLYVSSTASTPAGHVTNKTTTITRVARGAANPYNTTGDLGWMREGDIKLASIPTPTPTPAPSTSFKVGDTVKVSGYLTATAAGTGARTKSYNNQNAKIIMIRTGSARPYALNMNNNMNGVTGWGAQSQITK